MFSQKINTNWHTLTLEDTLQSQSWSPSSPASTGSFAFNYAESETVMLRCVVLWMTKPREDSVSRQYPMADFSPSSFSIEHLILKLHNCLSFNHFSFSKSRAWTSQQSPFRNWMLIWRTMRNDDDVGDLPVKRIELQDWIYSVLGIFCLRKSLHLSSFSPFLPCPVFAFTLTLALVFDTAFDVNCKVKCLVRWNGILCPLLRQGKTNLSLGFHCFHTLVNAQYFQLNTHHIIY